MSQLVPHGIFPRSTFDYDIWHRPLGGQSSTLDLFDPFDALDHNLCRNLHWIDRPDFLQSLIGPVEPRVPHKYRITVDCHGFDPKSIRTELTPDRSKVVVSAKEGDPQANEDGDFSVKEFRRSYKLPNNIEHDKMVSFVTGDGHLVIEFPVLPDASRANRRRESGDLFPVITEDHGQKHVHMNMDLPTNFDPSKVKVTCKDRDVIVQAEDKVEKPDGVSQFYYYRRSTLPESTDVDHLKCTVDQNKLMIDAPCSTHPRHSHRSIPIETTSLKQIKN